MCIALEILVKGLNALQSIKEESYNSLMENESHLSTDRFT